MKKLLALLLLLPCLCLRAGAEIPCRCGCGDCECFIQMGDEGPAVEYIQHALIAQGYLNANSDGEVFDERTRQAVLRFQAAHDLPQTGMMDDGTLTLLIWGMTPAELDRQSPASNGHAIWIPTDGGVRRHWRDYCCKMLDPRLVSVRNAAEMGMDPCGICNRKGKWEKTGDAP